MKKIKLFLAACAAMVGLSANAQSWTGSDPAAGTFFLYNVGAGKFINVGDKSAGWGTNAYLTAEYGLDFTFEANGTAYNLNTQVSNGGANYYLSTGLWCDGAATPWTFTKVDRTDINAYTISNGESYIVANAAGTDIEYVALSGTERDQWLIIGSTDILANLQANTAAGVKRTVATFFISDPDFGRNDLRMTPGNFVWSFTSTGGETVIPGRQTGYLGQNNTDVDGNHKNYGCQFWNNTFDIHQDLTSLPNGIYEFEIYGFGTNGTTSVYATTASGTTSKVFKNQTGATNFHTALENIDNYGGNVTGLVQVTDGKLTIGVKRETNSAADWTVIDQARLYYYGDYTFADAYGADLKDLIAEAQALVDVAPLAAVATDLSAAITTAQGVMNSGETEEDFATGKANLQSAIDAYNAKLTLVSRYVDVRAAALAVISNLDVTTSDANAVAATSATEVNAAVVTLRAAFQTALASIEIPADPGYIDVTAVMVDNASVRQNTNYWTIYNYEGYPNTSYSNGVTNYEETEFYQQQFKFYQTLALTPGTWEFGVTGFHRDGNHSTYFYAGEDKILIPGVASSVVNNMAGAKTYFDNGNGKVAVKFLIETASDVEIGIDNQDTETDRWTIFRDFTLKYYGAPDYSVYENQWTALVADANTAKTNNANVTGTELTALNAAIADSPAGSNDKATYLSKIDALQTALNTFNAAAPAYNAYVAYKNETITLWGSDLDVAAPTTAAEAVTAVQNLNVAQYNKVDNDYPYSLTSKIGDFSTWTGTATLGAERTADTPNSLSWEHWSGVTHSYYEQCGNGYNNAGGWTIQYQKTTTLPAGSYVVKVAARSSAGVTSSMTCTATDVTISLPCAGNNTRGINVDGEASWDDEDTFIKTGGINNDPATGVGFSGAGWQWRFLPFTLTEETEVTMTFYAEASTQYQWMSIGDGELLSAENIAEDVAYNEEATNEIEAVDVANVTITRTVKVGYNTVVLPFDLTSNQVAAAFGTGAVVYNFSENSDNENSVALNFTKVNAGTISANVPFLVKATAASTEQVFNGVQVVAPTKDAKVEGKYVDYVGVYAPTTLANGDFFLATKDNVQQIFQSEGNNDKVKGFRAYFKTKTTGENGVKAALFIDGVATAIEGINADANNDATIFNLAGQRVNKAQRSAQGDASLLKKGIYIVNGKKVIVK